MSQWNEDLISEESARTLDGLLVQRVRRSPERLAYRSYDRFAKSWADLNWSEVGVEVVIAASFRVSVNHTIA